MKKRISLSIPEACSERFEDFQETPRGGFCTRCQQEVYDFTDKTPEELHRFFAGQTGKVCGRFRQDQLDIPLKAPASPPKRAFSWAALLGLLTFSGLPAQAQEPSPQHISQQQAKNDAPTRPLNGKVMASETGTALANVRVHLQGKPDCEAFTDAEGRFTLQLPAETNQGTLIFSYGTARKEVAITRHTHGLHITLGGTGRVIRGTVFAASDHAPLPGISIHVYGTKIGTQSDFDGHYQITLPAGETPDTLVFSYLGNQKKVGISEEVTTKDVVLEDVYTTGGAVVVAGDIRIVKTPLHKRLWWKIKNLFRRR